MVSADICRLIRQAGKTMIIVTHDLSEAISLADKVYVLSARPATIKAVLPIRLTSGCITAGCQKCARISILFQTTLGGING